MIKIMFVCHGNICRSPMAEFIYKDMLKKCGREKDFAVASSATSAEEIWNGIGNPVYPPAKAELAEHGISCAGKRAVQLKSLFSISPRTSFRQILPIAALKKLTIRQYAFAFSPCPRQNYARKSTHVEILNRL